MLRAVLPAVLTALVLLPTSASAATLANWSHRQQLEVAARGTMAPLADGAFHGERPLTGPALQAALDAVGGEDTPRVLAPAGRVSVEGFDALVVSRIGLGDLAAAVRAEAARAGLRPARRFGTEVVARLLGLRFNHPAADEDLELYPTDPITRAEAAWTLAQVQRYDGTRQQWARDTLARFVLPRYSPGQLRALRIAVSRVGMPYVWGGETDTAGSLWGGQVHGGYDCSGLVWRVFKLGRQPAGPAIGGRTAAQQAGEIPRARRVAFDAIAPGDLLFFGPGRFWQRATEARIVHEGIALSGDWMVHASTQGVYVSPLFEDWRRAAFSWGRRVL